MNGIDLLPLLISGALGGVPALIAAVYGYGKLSERSKQNTQRCDENEKRMREHAENSNIHTSEDTRIRDAESRAETRARLTSIEHKIDLMMMGAGRKDEGS